MDKHIAIYARVSSRQQDTGSQEPDPKRWVKAQTVPVKWYRDKFTGKSMNRTAWNRLEKAIQTGKVEKVVIRRLDRLGRTAKGLTALFEDLRGRKVDLESLRDGFNLNAAAGRLMANVLASIAQYETEPNGPGGAPLPIIPVIIENMKRASPNENGTPHQVP